MGGSRAASVDNGGMETLRLHVDLEELENADSRRSLDRAAAILRDGGTVALPTETVYGLGANALNPEAVESIFRAKGRPGWDPLIVHVCDRAMLEEVVREISPAVEGLIGAFWPGPLTLLLPRSAKVPESVTAGRELAQASDSVLEAINPMLAHRANKSGLTKSGHRPC